MPPAPITRANNGGIKLVAAGEVMGVTYRQAKRVRRRGLPQSL
jgi:hypothetical protein